MQDAELSTPSYLTTDSLTSHAESTSSTVLYLLLSLLSLPSSTLSHAASHLGSAQTFATLLRGLPFHAKQGRMVIPAEITAKHGVIQEEVFRQGPQANGIEDAVFEFATLAHDHLNTARSMILNAEAEGASGRVPREAMPVFLAGVRVIGVVIRAFRRSADYSAIADLCYSGPGVKLPTTFGKVWIQCFRPEAANERRLVGL